MNDEIRVTVVATGLNQASKPELVKPNLQGVQANKADQVAAVSEPSINIAPVPTPASVPSPPQESIQSKSVEMMQQPELSLAEPEVVRKATVNGVDSVTSMSNSSYLDIPAFLRRQAD